jgi:hypothetical protein
MTIGEKILQRFTEQIEVAFVKAIRRGWTDPAVIVDVRNQKRLLQGVTRQRGVSASEIEPLVGKTISGDRQDLAKILYRLFPGSPAALDLGKETPPEAVAQIPSEKG